MFQWIGVSMVLAAWALPALFVLTLGFLFGLAVFRPLFLAWSRAWDAVGARLSQGIQVLAERMLARTDAHAIRRTH